MNKSKRCKVCKSVRPSYKCRECEEKYVKTIFLCIGDCFAKFHASPSNYIKKK